MMLQVWGLYGAFAPCMVYAGFGSSRQLVRLAGPSKPLVMLPRVRGLLTGFSTLLNGSIA